MDKKNYNALIVLKDVALDSYKLQDKFVGLHIEMDYRFGQTEIMRCNLIC